MADAAYPSGMENGYCAARAIMWHFDNPAMACEDYRQSTENLKSYMQRQWNFREGWLARLGRWNKE